MRISVILKAPAEKKKPVAAPLPRVGPGYVDDLLRRLNDQTRIPHPNGEPGHLYTVSNAAYQEACRLKDLDVIPELEEKIEQVTQQHEFAKLTHMVVSLLENTGDARLERLLSRLLKRVPNQPKFIEGVLLTLGGASTPEAREFAWKFIPNKKEPIESNALNVLSKAKNSKDYEPLLQLFEKQKSPKGLVNWIEALAATGGRRSIPALTRFKEENQKNRKALVRYGVLMAEAELAKMK